MSDGKVVWVTGAATGIGRASAILLATHKIGSVSNFGENLR